VAEFLSDEWVALLDRATRERFPAFERTLVVEQVVHRAGDEVRYHFVLDPDGARVVAGPASGPDLTLVVDAGTAARIATGRENAQQALADGRLKVRGRLDRLSGFDTVLARLGDVYADVRRATRFPEEAA
jgi:putative sterol carrier protein